MSKMPVNYLQIPNGIVGKTFGQTETIKISKKGIITLTKTAQNDVKRSRKV